MISHLNINSVRNKFHELSDLFIRSLVNILFLSETKLETEKLRLRLQDLNLIEKTGLLMVGEYWRMYEQTYPAVAVQTLKRQLSKVLSSRRQSVIGSGRFCVVIDPHHYQTTCLLMILPRVWITCMYISDNIIVIGDLNYDLTVPTKSKALKSVCDVFDSSSLVKRATCFTKTAPPSLIDVMHDRRDFDK